MDDRPDRTDEVDFSDSSGDFAPALADEAVRGRYGEPWERLGQPGDSCAVEGYRWLLERLKPVLWLHGHTPLATTRDWQVQVGRTTIVNVTGAVLIELTPPMPGARPIRRLGIRAGAKSEANGGPVESNTRSQKSPDLSKGRLGSIGPLDRERPDRHRGRAWRLWPQRLEASRPEPGPR